MRVCFVVFAAVLVAGCSPVSSLQPAASSANATAPARASSAAGGEIVKDEYLVVLRGAPGASARAQNLRTAESIASGAGVTMRHAFGTVLSGFSARMSAEQAARLANDPAVALVEPNRVAVAYGQVVPAGVTMVRASAAQSRGVRGAGVKVGVIDTGIDYRHPDLAANYAGGIDLVNNDADPMDDNGHGTHVSGTIAAVDNTLGVLGVAPGVKLYGIKVLDANGSGTYAQVIAGLDWAAANHMQVVNLSLGGSVGSSALQTAVDNAFKAGVVVCAAAGNSGGAVGFPAAYPSCICVSAVDANKQIAAFSSRGPEVDVAAPGTGVLSTYPNAAYATMQGTSMATPHVAAVAALVWGTGRYTQAAAVRERVVGTSGDLGVKGADPLYGSGLLDADAATAPPPNVLPVPRAGGPYAAFVNAPVAFSSAGSTDPDGTIVGWAWAFGDGASSTAASPSHAYAAAGNYTASLTVTDDRGGKTSATVAVSVKADVVTITSAEYVKSTKTLSGVATSNAADAALGVTGQGAMTYDATGKRWTLARVLTAAPASVAVTSSRGGRATRAVTVK